MYILFGIFRTKVWYPNFSAWEIADFISSDYVLVCFIRLISLRI